MSASEKTDVESPSLKNAQNDVEKQPEQPKVNGPDPQAIFRMALKKVVMNGVLLIIVFWAVACWLFGSFWHTTSKAHQLHVLVVDFDGGPVGAALLAAVGSVNGGPSVPTFDIVAANTVSVDAVNKKVWDGQFWGAIYSAPNASANYAAALASDAVAATYDPAQALIYTGIEARYYTAWSGVVLSSLKQVVAITAEVFAKQTVVPFLQSLNGTTTVGANQAVVLAGPISSSFLNQAPFPMGDRSVLNTIGFVYPVLLQFFLLGFNGIFIMTGVYKRSNFRQQVAFRVPISFIWCIIGGISVIGWALTFKETLHVSAGHIFALFAIASAYAMIMFDLLDAITAFVPMPFVPFVTIFLIIVSVAATAYPIELEAAFFRVHYAVPSHAAWKLMIVCYGGGATAASTVHVDLPILMCWLVLAKCIALLGIRRHVQNHYKASSV